MATTEQIHFRLKVIFSGIGICVALSVFCAFGFRFSNWNTAIWGLASGIPAAVALYVHIRSHRQTWDSVPYQLKFYMLCGCLTQLAGVCGFVTYLTLAITQHQGLKIEGEGYFLTCVWCFMVWKWGFLLFYFSRQYRRQYFNVYTILPQEEQETRKSYGPS